MNLKENLKQLQDIGKEITEIIKKLKKIEKQISIITDSVQASSNSSPYTKRNIIIKGKDIKRQARLDKYKNILEEKYDKLLDQQITTVEFIDKINNSRIRRILKYRYIEQYSWVKIATLIGGTSTADSVRMEHDRFLEKI